MLNSKFSVHCDTDFHFVAINLSSDFGLTIHQFNVINKDTSKGGKQWSLDIGSKIQEFKLIARTLKTTPKKLRKRLVDEFIDKLKLEKNG
tara:strand:+ start:9572 stop:9841 length:270 start_codon:yes stop_codon:yes gene_type:complete